MLTLKEEKNNVVPFESSKSIKKENKFSLLNKSNCTKKELQYSKIDKNPFKFFQDWSNF